MSEVRDESLESGFELVSHLSNFLMFAIEQTENLPARILH